MTAAFVKILAASLVMAAAAFGAERGLEALLPGRSFLLQGLRVLSAIAAGTLVLGVLARLLGIEEFREAMELVGKKLGWGRGGGKGPGGGASPGGQAAQA